MIYAGAKLGRFKRNQACHVCPSIPPSSGHAPKQTNSMHTYLGAYLHTYLFPKERLRRSGQAALTSRAFSNSLGLLSSSLDFGLPAGQPKPTTQHAAHHPFPSHLSITCHLNPSQRLRTSRTSPSLSKFLRSVQHHSYVCMCQAQSKETFAVAPGLPRRDTPRVSAFPV